jgi:lysine-N-methylase
MPLLPLQLPTLQNWSCHNCGGCCKQHLIEITDEERTRILSQNWTAADGVPAHRPVVEWFAGPFWRKRYRLAHQPDGACVFLDDRGLCRIHAKFGEAAKPLACRVYPYALHPHGKAVTVSLRYSCPSVVSNLGQPVAAQTDDLKQIEALVVPAGAERMLPPRLSEHERVDWPTFDRIVELLDQFLEDARTPLLVRLFRALAYANLIGQSRFEKLDGPRLREFLGLLTKAILTEFQKLPEHIDEPSPLGGLYFRLFAAQYARKDTFADLSAGWWGRWRLLRAVLKFSRGTGDAPPLQECFRPVPFAALDEPHGGLPNGAAELFTRYLRVKVQGLHFCGPAYYQVPFVEGLHSLVLMVPITLWLARWLARSSGRTMIELADVEHALAIADHHHGYADALGQRHARSRIRHLAESGDLSRLCVWAAR